MEKDLLPSQLVQALFILTSEEVVEYRKNLFTQIHEIVFHGQGGYDWETIYNMPIWLRKFTFNQINTFYTKKQQHQEQKSKNPNQKTIIDSTGKVKAPEFLKAPTYK